MYKFQVPIPRGAKSIRIVVGGEDATTSFLSEDHAEYTFESYIPWKYSNNSNLDDGYFQIFADFTKKNSKSIELVPTLLSKRI